MWLQGHRAFQKNVSVSSKQKVCLPFCFTFFLGYFTSVALIYTYGWLHTFRSDLLSFLLDILLNKCLLNYYYLALNRCPINTLLLQI